MVASIVDLPDEIQFVEIARFLDEPSKHSFCFTSKRHYNNLKIGFLDKFDPWQYLYECVELGYPNLIFDAIHSGLEVDVDILEIAVHLNQTEVALKLIEVLAYQEGWAREVTLTRKSVPLLSACRNGNSELVEKLWLSGWEYKAITVLLSSGHYELAADRIRRIKASGDTGSIFNNTGSYFYGILFACGQGGSPEGSELIRSLEYNSENDFVPIMAGSMDSVNAITFLDRFQELCPKANFEEISNGLFKSSPLITRRELFSAFEAFATKYPALVSKFSAEIVRTALRHPNLNVLKWFTKQGHTFGDDALTRAIVCTPFEPGTYVDSRFLQEDQDERFAIIMYLMELGLTFSFGVNFFKLLNWASPEQFQSLIDPSSLTSLLRVESFNDPLLDYFLRNDCDVEFVEFLMDMCNVKPLSATIFVASLCPNALDLLRPILRKARAHSPPEILEAFKLFLGFYQITVAGPKAIKSKYKGIIETLVKKSLRSRPHLCTLANYRRIPFSRFSKVVRVFFDFASIDYNQKFLKKFQKLDLDLPSKRELVLKFVEEMNQLSSKSDNQKTESPLVLEQ